MSFPALSRQQETNKCPRELQNVEQKLSLLLFSSPSFSFRLPFKLGTGWF